ncbi:MAG TPA: sensor domain-containing diguanylate cyclase [Bacteroidetes bacterium]|nr:sensor domain-containing diguanylate cyclase [Bacteroidota bacterium]
MDTARFIDYRTVRLILFHALFSALAGLLVFIPGLPLPLWARLLIAFFLILAASISVSRNLSARIITLTDELTETGVSVRTKKYRQQIDSATEELRLLNRKLKRHIYELHNLFHISMDLTSILDMDQLINSYLNTLIGQLRIKNATLFLHSNTNSTELELVRAKGISEEDVAELKFDTRDSIVKMLFQKRQPIVIAEELTSLKEIEKFRMLDSEVIAPLIHSHRLEGLVILGTKINGEPYSQTDLEMVTLITNIVAVAVANARLYQRVKEISITDELTSLYNYRYFRMRLRDEVFRSQRTGRPLSLVILDVDYFKNYNDNLGHPAGDQVLKQIARILKNSVRDTDVVARYGGEEFCVILPEVDVQGARAFGERLRKNIEDYPFYKEEIQPGGKLTVSLGAATYPQDATMINELLVRADKALYHAKNSGRNRMSLYSEIKS